MDIGLLWGQWVGLLGRLQGNQVQASSKCLTVSFLAAFTFFTPWLPVFLRSESPSSPDSGLAKRTSKSGILLGEIPQSNHHFWWNPHFWWAGLGQNCHPRGRRASCLCAFQASKVFGDFNGEIMGFHGRKTVKNSDVIGFSWGFKGIWSRTLWLTFWSSKMVCWNPPFSEPCWSPEGTISPTGVDPENHQSFCESSLSTHISQGLC